jgi:hypothetical protein
LAELVARYLNDMLSDEEVELLNRRMDGDDGLQDLFVIYAKLHGAMTEWGSGLAASAASQGWDRMAEEQDDSAGPSGNATVSLHDAIVQPALKMGDDVADTGGESPRLAAEPDPAPVREGSATVPSPPRRAGSHIAGWARRGGLAAGLLLVLGGSIWFVWPSRPTAVISATAAAVVNGESLSSPGARSLVAGQSLAVSAGAIELTMGDGAQVVIAAPSQVRVVDRATLALDYGSVAAHVPRRGIGFRVDAPGLSAVDRGTNFGVRTVDGGATSELAVFDGNVDAAARTDEQHPTSAAVRVTGGHAVRATAGATDAGVADAAYAPEAFPRDITAIRLRVKIHATGVGIAAGSADPYWQVESVPGDAAWAARPAIVALAKTSRYPANTLASQWIGAPNSPSFNGGGDYVFQTSVDLTDLNPATADVVAHVAADQGIVDLFVNGTPVAGASMLLDSPGDPVRSADLRVPNTAWLPHLNKVELIVKYIPGHAPERDLPGVQVGWEATASPIVHR